MFIPADLLFENAEDRMKRLGLPWNDGRVAISVTPRIDLVMTNGRTRSGARTYVIAIPFEQWRAFGTNSNPRKQFWTDAEAIAWANKWLDKKVDAM